MNADTRKIFNRLFGSEIHHDQLPDLPFIEQFKWVNSESEDAATILLQSVVHEGLQGRSPAGWTLADGGIAICVLRRG